ncbi:uncharacterized protein LOC108864178 [Galendromus occidentalis]|uniref:Uncharacterized protein LOC108864178 n=1 Tax=Galendromus occidentalis TaxID=34638 RepID=A0AAJ7WHB7_9ACAR|nr:uncharacterized protein LOC108864178 [Galendromus occidentalis]
MDEEDPHAIPVEGPADESSIDRDANPETLPNEIASDTVTDCNPIGGTGSENCVQSSSEKQYCDVEEVLQRTVDSVISNEIEERGHVHSVAFPSDAASEALSLGPSVITPSIDGPHHPGGISVKDNGVGCVEEDRGALAGDNAERGEDILLKDDEDDFGDFGEFSNAHEVESSVVTNGLAQEVGHGGEDTSCVNHDDENDDDFGDFEEADLGNSASNAPTHEFAQFDNASLAAGRIASEDPVTPASPESFRSLIAELFIVVDHESRELVDQPVETGHFQASVDRDIARCEDVDNWPCVLFSYDSSRTRRTLLSSLCIDETPANCPRFAIDCLNNDFLQPVKESKGSSPPTSGDGRELSERAKEVLNKIPDLSFMKAEVLTFPATVQAP